MSLDRDSPRSRFFSSRLRRDLLCWYEEHKRDLPWRANRDPYRIWISEIMLQQTRVAAVTEYYRRFLKRFPTIEDLAAAPMATVLAAWSGLGYYRRARMLHAAAQLIVSERAGAFPETAEELRGLPGIGRYTAAAIASIVFDEAIAVVDGNVARVVERIWGESLTREAVWDLAQTWVSRRRPGDFNQALMELGATVCLPGQPRCLACPLVELCATRGALAGGERQKRQKREVYYLLSRRNGSVFLVQRAAESSLMPEMWELPEVDSEGKLARDNGERVLPLRHSITVTDYRVYVLERRAVAPANGRWVACSQASELPLTGLTRKILRKAKII